jgi:peptide deformylase
MKSSSENHELKLVLYPDDILLKKCEDVTEFNEELAKIISDMEKIMLDHKGMGLAANQVGLSKRIFLLKNKDGVVHFINPVIVEQEGHVFLDEGCLSAPGAFVQVPRSEQVMVKAKNLQGEEFRVVWYCL